MRNRLPLLAITLVFLMAGLAAAEDWPQWRGLHRDGKSPETGLLKRWPDAGPKLLWKADGLGEGYSQPTVAGGVVYVTGSVKGTGHTFAIADGGKLKWKTPYGKAWKKQYNGPRTAPTIDDGRVYILSAYGQLVCMKAEDGGKLWERNVLKEFGGKNHMRGFTESVIIDGDHLICTPGGKDAAMVALDRSSGKTIWKTAGLKEKAAQCSPLLFEHGGRRLLTTCMATRVIGVDAETGKLLWTVPFRNRWGQSPNTPVYADGIVYVTAGDKSGGIGIELSADGTSARKKWSDGTLDCQHANVILLDGHIYGAPQKGGRWICLELKTGKVKSTSRAVPKGCATYADGMLYCYGENGAMNLVKPDPKGLEVVSSFKIKHGRKQHWAHPSISDGRLYVRHGDAMMCYDIRAE